MVDTAGSSIIAAFGAGSGINFTQLADDIADATFLAQRTNLQSRNETLEAQISSASLLRNSLTGLASALGDRIRDGDISPRATIGDPSVVSVSTTSGLTPRGSYSLEVSQLADSQTLVSQSYGSGEDLVGEGTLRIRFGEVDGVSFTEDTGQTPLEIAIAADDTLEDVANAINAASDGAVSAYVAEGTGGAQLVLKGQEGAVNGFTLEGESSAASPSAIQGDLSYLSWTPATDTGELRQTAQNAEFELDTVAFSSASNTIADLPEGLTFELTSTNAGSPTDISFNTDNAAITSVMSDFVEALNEVATLLNEEAAALGGTLANDPGARALRRDLQTLTSETVIPNADADEPSTLADLGLSINQDGTFSLDTARLNATLAANPEATAAMFTTGAFGVFATFDSLARENTLSSDPGSLGGSLERYQDLIDTNNERLEDIAEDQEALRARLTSDFVAAEQRISSSQSTLDFLRLQFNSDSDS